MSTRIRIDVAHHSNKYRRFLRGTNRRVHTLYMAAMGTLRTTENMKEAEEIIEAIFVLSKSEGGGLLPDGTESECPKGKCGWKSELQVNALIILF